MLDLLATVIFYIFVIATLTKLLGKGNKTEELWSTSPKFAYCRCRCLIVLPDHSRAMMHRIHSIPNVESRTPLLV